MGASRDTPSSRLVYAICVNRVRIAPISRMISTAPTLKPARIATARGALITVGSDDSSDETGDDELWLLAASTAVGAGWVGLLEDSVVG